MKFLFVVFLLPLQLFAQDITGVWTGTLYSDTTQFIKYELAVTEYSGKLSGYSHTIFVIDGVENIGVKSIKIKKEGEEFLVEDDKLVYNNYTALPPKGIKQYSKLLLSQNDTSMVLSVPWKTNKTRQYKGITGIIFLQKAKKIKETLIVAKLEDLGLMSSLSFMTSPTQSKDLGVVNSPVFNQGEPKNQSADIAKHIISTTTFSAHSETQQSAKHVIAEKQISQEDLDKKVSAEESAQKRDEQLSVANIPTQKDKTTNLLLSANIPIKSDSSRINKQKKTEKNIHDIVLNKGDSARNKGIIKELSSPILEIALLKKEPTNTVSIKSASQQINKQQKSGKNTSKLVFNKDDSSGNKSILKEVPSLTTEMPMPKEPINTMLIKSEIQQFDNSQKIDNKNHSIVLSTSAPIERENNRAGIKTEIKTVSQPAAEIATRKIETIRRVDIKSDSLLLTLYDNGEIDGDTVSVLLNGKVIMPMQGLMSKAINKTIYLTPEMSDSIVLIMYAENLGSIPPNTGLLVVHDGEDIYEIRFSGDLQKNSAIILKRRRKN